MAEKILSKFSRLKDFQRKRQENSEKYHKLNVFLVFISC